MSTPLGSPNKQYFLSRVSDPGPETEYQKLLNDPNSYLEYSDYLQVSQDNKIRKSPASNNLHADTLQSIGEKR